MHVNLFISPLFIIIGNGSRSNPTTATAPTTLGHPGSRHSRPATATNAATSTTTTSWLSHQHDGSSLSATTATASTKPAATSSYCSPIGCTAITGDETVVVGLSVPKTSFFPSLPSHPARFLCTYKKIQKRGTRATLPYCTPCLSSVLPQATPPPAPTPQQKGKKIDSAIVVPSYYESFNKNLIKQKGSGSCISREGMISLGQRDGSSLAELSSQVTRPLSGVASGSPIQLGCKPSE